MGHLNSVRYTAATSSAAAVVRPRPNYCQLPGNYTILVESTLRSFVSSESPLGSAQTLKPSSGMCSTGAPGQFGWIVRLVEWGGGGVGGWVIGLDNLDKGCIKVRIIQSTQSLVTSLISQIRENEVCNYTL
ncbi:hypothetical protein GX48_01365 [Paracoccidioides brasiliensis]|nr:hypothetical protein GX48_01365 [Paracoccidioides brasiliensis]